MSVKVNASLQLSFDLLIRKLKSRNSKNVVVSPLSLDAVVAMAGAGCSPSSAAEVLKFADCETVDELKSKFAKSLDITKTNSGKDSEDPPVKYPSRGGGRLISSGYHPYRGGGRGFGRGRGYRERSAPANNKDPKISFVNAVWVDKRILLQPEYEECLKDVFKIEASTTCDFVNKVDEAVEKINSWAESQTNGLIKNIVTPDYFFLMEVILTNALYFKGFWLDKTFDRKNTKQRNFYLVNGEKVPRVPFMTSYRGQLFGSFDEFKVLEIPYQSSTSSKTKQFCMQFILPHEKDGLKTLLEKLEKDGFLDFELEYTLFKDLWIPKFKFSATLGEDDLKFPFLEGVKGLELTKMVQNREGFKYRTKICQKAFIEVDEEGTEAAAVTCGGAGGGRPPPPTGIFVADHPFLFIIKEKISGLVLFAGTLLNPLES